MMASAVKRRGAAPARKYGLSVAALAAVKGICSPESTTPSLSVSTQVRIVLVLASFNAS